MLYHIASLIKFFWGCKDRNCENIKLGQTLHTNLQKPGIRLQHLGQNLPSSVTI